MNEAAEKLRSRSCPSCVICGSHGDHLYSTLGDRLFDAPGDWNFKVCPNPSCGLIWLDPMPLAEDLAHAYETYYTHTDAHENADSSSRRIYQWAREGYRARYLDYPCDNIGKKILGLALRLFPGRAEDAAFCAMYLHAKPGGRLLELGCGTGQMLLAMRKLGWEVEGVDFDPEAVRNARLKGLDVRYGELYQQGYEQDSFDAIFMSHVIEHVHNPLELMEECLRVLKPGGRLVVVTPNAASWGHRLYGNDWRGLEPPRHLQIFTPAALSSAATRSGFANANARSSPRARGMFLASESLRRTNGLEVALNPTLSLLLWAEAMEFMEWLRIFWDRNAGEEVVLTAYKGK